MNFSKLVLAGIAALGLDTFVRKLTEDGDAGRTVARIFGTAKNLGAMAADKMASFATSAMQDAENLFKALREILHKARNEADKTYVKDTLARLDEEIPTLNEELQRVARRLKELTSRRNNLFGRDMDYTQVQSDLTRMRMQHAAIEASYHAAVNLRRKLRAELAAADPQATTQPPNSDT